MRPFNIMIVDDSKFMRESIINLLKTEQDMNIAAEASNGLEAINTLKSSTIPIDVIIMDIEMPIMDGAEATKVIMKEKPTSIILLSALTREHKKTITALLNGAFDFIQKPGGKSITFDIDKVKKDLIEKIRFSAIANLTQRFGKKKEFEAAKRKISRYYDLVLIGTSTGGPGTLAKIFKIMPASFDIPIAVVQHIKEGYSKSLAEGLNSASALDISEVDGFTNIVNGKVYIAKAGYHLEFCATGTQLKLTNSEFRNGFRPSVDVLFESALANFKGKILAVVLTGMGNDGAAGAAKLYNAGHTVIIQDENTSVVWGMPRVIYEAGTYHAILPINEIAETLANLKHTP